MGIFRVLVSNRVILSFMSASFLGRSKDFQKPKLLSCMSYSVSGLFFKLEDCILEVKKIYFEGAGRRLHVRQNVCSFVSEAKQ